MVEGFWTLSSNMNLDVVEVTVMACGRVSEGSANSVEFVGTEPSLTPLNQYLHWDVGFI